MPATAIAVYADWHGLSAPLRLGWLHARSSANREVFEFAFDKVALDHSRLGNPPLDPRLGLFPGPQYPAQGRKNFGLFEDASPDRWGRMLMQRRFERAQRAGLADKSARLHESDYLLGVHDAFRMGALRFRRGDEGAFLDDQHGVAAPPFVKLRALEKASLALERDRDNTAKAADQWLTMLIAPGGSLGGARPKASVVDPHNRVWIAKFPSVRDERDMGAWEMVLQSLAQACGLKVPQSLTRRFANRHHTFLAKRFDRIGDGQRLHFASAMTLTDHQDGDDASTGASYLEIARVLIDHGAQTNADLRELWSRIVFNVLVSNSDDHLRNHGFLLVPGKGWRLAPAYDMNPVPDADGLKLNITQADNALDLALAREVAEYFRLKPGEASQIIADSQAVVRQWHKIAGALRIPASEQDYMAPAFRLAEAA